MGKLQTRHKITTGDARRLSHVENESIDLVITSPPYPMIAMWDEIFGSLNPKINTKLINSDERVAYELMHRELDKVWTEVGRTLKPGGIVCINIGDATRTINGEFRLYPNHSRIIEHFLHQGFSNLPNIIWKKPTNAPNKFMGSGTLPVGAYVTLEHEFVLIFRKQAKREFRNTDTKALRTESAFFWEERNLWFSDNWELKGTPQKLFNGNRKRSAAFPFELPHRLISMYSIIGDTILDPFSGTGTTSLAAIINGRNSIATELDKSLNDSFFDTAENIPGTAKQMINQRLKRHTDFVRQHGDNNLKHHNIHYDFKVKTRQERTLKFPVVIDVDIQNDVLFADYK